MTWIEHLQHHIRAQIAETRLIYADVRDCIRSLIHGMKGGWD